MSQRCRTCIGLKGPSSLFCCWALRGVGTGCCCPGSLGEGDRTPTPAGPGVPRGDAGGTRAPEPAVVRAGGLLSAAPGFVRSSGSSSGFTLQAQHMQSDGLIQLRVDTLSTHTHADTNTCTMRCMPMRLLPGTRVADLTTCTGLAPMIQAGPVCHHEITPVTEMLVLR